MLPSSVGKLCEGVFLPSLHISSFLYLLRGSSSDESKESDSEDEVSWDLPEDMPPEDRYATVMSLWLLSLS